MLFCVHIFIVRSPMTLTQDSVIASIRQNEEKLLQNLPDIFKKYNISIETEDIHGRKCYVGENNTFGIVLYAVYLNKHYEGVINHDNYEKDSNITKYYQFEFSLNVDEDAFKASVGKDMILLTNEVEKFLHKSIVEAGVMNIELTGRTFNVDRNFVFKVKNIIKNTYTITFRFNTNFFVKIDPTVALQDYVTVINEFCERFAITN